MFPIVAGIRSLFEKDGPFEMDENDFQKKIVSCTADGASVNFGQHTGVLTQIKRDRPWLLTIHCVNHRVELAVKSAFDIDELKKVDEFYLTNFYLLRNSGKLKQEVAKASEVLGITHYVLPKLTGTRFVSHRRRGYTNLIETWPAFIMAYENYASDSKSSTAQTRAKVAGLLKKFKSYTFLSTVTAYLDLLEMIVPASKSF